MQAGTSYKLFIHCQITMMPVRYFQKINRYFTKKALIFKNCTIKNTTLCYFNTFSLKKLTNKFKINNTNVNKNICNQNKNQNKHKIFTNLQIFFVFKWFFAGFVLI